MPFNQNHNTNCTSFGMKRFWVFYSCVWLCFLSPTCNDSYWCGCHSDKHFLLFQWRSSSNRM